MNIFYTKAIGLTIGAAIQGLAMALFFFPHAISSGGAAGISIILNALFDIPHATTLWLLNIVMLFIAVKWLGKQSAIWTIYCVTVTSFVVSHLSLEGPINSVVFDLAVGSVIFGVGIGILFRLGASSGGMDILALIISKASKKPAGRILFWINTIILLMTGFVVNVQVIFFALLSQWVSTRIIDIIGKVRIRVKAGLEV
ncbi:YitT family protein [Bacillus solimangrovi]|uniref:YitT family protein n=1 Tax=Bacillus solimangrovi TaxID=1305675 RepID=A0A1E5LBW2_9BACI|nr:YitT family protein [Bacillus solimangrovi]OEH91578.1 hypothetical protein BFG57_04170 [Bacillus solimangrovi]